MTVYEAVMKRRTIRKFKQIKIDHKDLVKACGLRKNGTICCQRAAFKI